MDEEYLACLLECTITGTTDPSFVQRQNVARILESRPALRSRLDLARVTDETGSGFHIEEKRVRRVLIKLARGHAGFELHEEHREEPLAFGFGAIQSFHDAQRTLFERPPAMPAWPEVGSRAMQRLAISFPHGPGWLTVQPDRYRYLTAVTGDGIVVRIVLGEYLAAEVVWR